MSGGSSIPPSKHENKAPGPQGEGTEGHGDHATDEHGPGDAFDRIRSDHEVHPCLLRWGAFLQGRDNDPPAGQKRNITDGSAPGTPEPIGQGK